NCAEWACLQFGCALAGVILVNVNPAYRTHDLAFVLKKSRMKALFLRSKDTRSNYREILEQAAAGQKLELREAIFLESDWKGFLKERDGVVVRIDPSDAANIQYTSGTTGQPKGVLLSHINTLNNGVHIAQYMKMTEEDRVCVPVPLFHCFGCVAGTTAGAVSGATVVLPAATFDPKSTMEAIDAERCTVIYGVPAMFIAELQHPEFHHYRFESLRTGIMAGAPCPIEIMRRVVSEMHCPDMVVAYGQTEASPVITMSRTDDTLENRCTTVGSAIPEVEVRIATPDGETVEAGHQGELQTRGYLVMKGYDDEPEATAQAIDEEGWLHTGDLAVMREDGYFRITGRAKDMIIRGGENVYPREVEEFLYTHPAVAEVQVVGLPDDRLGEVVCAWIRLKAGETADDEGIRAFCNGRLAHYKVPQYIRFVDSYPMTLSGKVQKFRIREIEIEERGLWDAERTQTA
ncbi:MAG TPA: AMP-binding protein, partial [Bryobacteraceae bacterium]|nr:AMP-binding protein [Bryobacteraceae bacterium]